MTIYRNKEDGKLYWIEHLIKDIMHLNNNAFAGIYAYPLFFGNKYPRNELIFMDKNHDNCRKFVEDNFEKVSVI